MGMIITISLPLILLYIGIDFGCYFLGRAKGRQELYTNVQIFGAPTPPPSTIASANSHTSPLPPHFKKRQFRQCLRLFEHFYKDNPRFVLNDVENYWVLSELV
ncbi:mesh like, partial [Olea europaea subsp. europaea]